MPEVRDEIKKILPGKVEFREIKVTNPKIFKYLNGDEAYFDGVILLINL